MPIRAKRELICEKCGKKFSVTLGDAIMPDEQKLLENPICPKCKIFKKIQKEKNNE